MSPWITEIGPLDAGHRQALQLHLMALDRNDRYARFGRTMSDDAVLGWVQSLNWYQAQWWGAWSAAETGLLGGLQLTPTLHTGVCELALTVHPCARHQGVATALLKYVAETRTETDLKALVCENGHPAVVRMARTLGLGLRMRVEAPRMWLTLPAHRI
jgi:GNAT superfamily N-acetyltransferase